MLKLVQYMHNDDGRIDDPQARRVLGEIDYDMIRHINYPDVQ